jgi:anti-sigma regulatory factor (Ser/Thr protein kinase)
MTSRKKTTEIRRFIAANVAIHPGDMAALIASEFDLSRQAARKHLSSMVKDGLLTVTGRTRNRKYQLAFLVNQTTGIETNNLFEDAVWTEYIVPHLSGLPENVIQVLSIATSEMLNNVIDHSESDRLQLTVIRTAAAVDVIIRDFGVGVFKKVQEAFNLIDERQAILELSKGRLTTAPDQHSGYGIFFTSRMVNSFKLWSGRLFFHHTDNVEDWLIGFDTEIQGTYAALTVRSDSQLSPKDVYDKFCSDPNLESDIGFHRTHVPLKLAQFGNESLVSRSQAKRVLSRFDRFREVMLDFNGVEFVGQAFIDEIFRVFRLQHPDVRVIAINANRQVQQMLNLARSIGNANKASPSLQSDDKTRLESE